MAYWRASSAATVPGSFSTSRKRFPERLATLEDVFETACDEVAIPPDASSDRDALAAKILRAGETIKSEMMLVLTAMQTAMEGRR